MVQFATQSLSVIWPGYRRAWNRADLPSLATAVFFSWLICGLLVTTFVYYDWFPGSFRFVAWTVCILAAVFTAVRTLIFGDMPEKDSRAARDENLKLAQATYLQASYFEAEKLLLENLAKQPADIESSLLLVSVYRRTERWEKGLELIQQLLKREMAARWYSEIAAEKERCLRGKRQLKEESPTTP